MAELVCVLIAVVVGCMLAYRFGRFQTFAPAWAGVLLIFGSGAAAGFGVTSCVFFICRLFTASPLVPMAVEAALAVWLAIEVYRMGRPAAPEKEQQPYRWNPVLALALILVLMIATGAMWDAWQSNPQGGWDAWAIWNLRARFLASPGDLASRAWSPLIGSATHPEYPLLTSGFVARCWAYAGSMTEAAPVAASYLYFLALIALGTGALAALRGGASGLLFGLAIAGSPFLLHEVPAQYADVPLACYFTAAVLMLMLDRPAAAGLFASMAAWTKDEGLAFLALFLIVTALLRRERIVRALAGAAPVTAVLLVFKLVLAQGADSMLARSASGLASRLTGPARYLTVLQAFLGQCWDMRNGWYHPLLPVLALAIALRFRKQWRRDMLLPGTAALGMLAVYFGVYVVTANDLQWQLQTSLARLSVQVWPLIVLALFAGMNAPVSAAAAVQAPPPLKHKKKSR